MTTSSSSSGQSKISFRVGKIKKKPKGSSSSTKTNKSKRKKKKEKKPTKLKLSKRRKSSKVKIKKEKKEKSKRERIRRTKSDSTATRKRSPTTTATTATTSSTQYTPDTDQESSAKKRRACCWKPHSDHTSEGKTDSKPVVIQDPKAGISLVFDPRYTCNPYYRPSSKVPKDFRKLRTIPPAVQPVVGVCTEETCTRVGDVGGERLMEVRYALVRISVFPNYTTYEIMKSSKKKPKKVPDTVEGIFVTKR